MAVPIGKIKSIYSYDAEDESELTFPVGVVFDLIRKDDENWWTGVYNGMEGMFPSNFVQEVGTGGADVIPPANELSQYATAEFDFEAKRPSELAFVAGDVIRVLSMDGNWWKGELNGRSGLFPSSYVYLNEDDIEEYDPGSVEDALGVGGTQQRSTPAVTSSAIVQQQFETGGQPMAAVPSGPTPEELAAQARAEEEERFQREQEEKAKKRKEMAMRGGMAAGFNPFAAGGGAPNLRGVLRGRGGSSSVAGPRGGASAGGAAGGARGGRSSPRGRTRGPPRGRARAGGAVGAAPGAPERPPDEEVKAQGVKPRGGGAVARGNPNAAAAAAGGAGRSRGPRPVSAGSKPGGAAGGAGAGPAGAARPTSAGRAAGGSQVGVGKTAAGGSQVGVGKTAAAQSPRPAAAPAAPTTPPAVDEPVQPKVVRARALYDYTGEESSELNFKANDIITILEKDMTSGWWKGELNGVIGYISHAFVEEIKDVTPQQREKALRIQKEREDKERRGKEEAEAVEREEKVAKEAAERKAKEEEDRKAKAEADRKAKEEEDRKAKADAERKAKEEAGRKAKAEAERKAKEEADRKGKAEAERKAKAEADRKTKEEAERTAKEEADRKAKAEAERKAKEEADRKDKEEADRKDKAESDRKAKEEAERKAKEESEAKDKEEAVSAKAVEPTEGASAVPAGRGAGRARRPPTGRGRARPPPPGSAAPSRAATAGSPSGLSASEGVGIGDGPAKGKSADGSAVDFLVPLDAPPPKQYEKQIVKKTRLVKVKKEGSGKQMVEGSFDYTAEGEGELSFKAGTVFEVLEMDPAGWWKAIIDGTVGYIPKDFVTVLPVEEEYDEIEEEYEEEVLVEIEPPSIFDEVKASAPLTTVKKTGRSSRRPPSRGARPPPPKAEAPAAKPKKDENLSDTASMLLREAGVSQGQLAKDRAHLDALERGEVPSQPRYPQGPALGFGMMVGLPGARKSTGAIGVGSLDDSGIGSQPRGGARGRTRGPPRGGRAGAGRTGGQPPGGESKRHTLHVTEQETQELRAQIGAHPSLSRGRPVRSSSPQLSVPGLDAVLSGRGRSRSASSENIGGQMRSGSGSAVSPGGTSQGRGRAAPGGTAGAGSRPASSSSPTVLVPRGAAEKAAASPVRSGSVGRAQAPATAGQGRAAPAGRARARSRGPAGSSAAGGSSSSIAASSGGSASPKAAKAQEADDGPPRTKPPVAKPVADSRKRAVVTFNYEGQGNELSLVKDEKIIILEQHESGWWKGENEHGKQGWFPESFVQVL